MKKVLFLILFLLVSVRADAVISIWSHPAVSEGGTGEITVPESAVLTTADSGATRDIIMPPSQSGDVMVIAFMNARSGNPAGTVSSAPTGFSQIDSETSTGGTSDLNFSMWYKVMSGTEGTSVQIGVSNTDADTAAIALVFRGVDNDTPLDNTPPAFNVGTHPITSPSITTQTANAMVISAGAQDGTTGAIDDTDIPTDYTLGDTYATSSFTNGGNLGLAYKVYAETGATGAIAWQTNTGTEECVGGTVALRPQ